MDLIDDEGNILGLVNVIDALAVLLVVAVVVAGVAFVNPFAPPPQPAVRYATIDLGTQPSYLVDRIDVGDTMSLQNSPDNLTITDVYLGPTGNATQVVVRAKLVGEQAVTGGGRIQFTFGGNPLLTGQPLTIQTLAYKVSGRVTQWATGGRTLPTTQSTVVAAATVPTAVAGHVAVGDTYRIGGHAVAVVRSLTRSPTADVGTERVVLGLELSTIQRDGATRFGPTPVRVGASLPLATPNYALRTLVLQIGTDRMPTAETKVVLETTVPADVAGTIQPGDAMTLSGSTVASLDSVSVYPTNETTTDRLVAGATLRTLDDAGQTLFAGRNVQVGASVPFRTEAYGFTGTVVRRDGVEPPGTPATATLTVELKNVDPAVANAIRVGETETSRDRTLARVVARNATPATVILTSQDGHIYARKHPRNLDVRLTVEVHGRRTASGLTFNAQPVRIGDTVVLDLGEVRVRGEVVGISTS